jgi:tryptophan-rich sensory protein
MTVLASRAQIRASFLRWALFLVPLVLLLGFLSGKVSGSSAQNPWFAALKMPAIYPDPIVFPIAWTTRYVLMGLAAALVCSAWGARWRGVAMVLFAIQLGINLAWSPVFFQLHQIENAFYVIAALDGAVALTLILFFIVRKLAALLLLPYLAWIAFATFLHWQILLLNPDATSYETSAPVQRVEL